MNRFYFLIIAVTILGCAGCEGIFSSDDLEKNNFTAENAKVMAANSSESDSTTLEITLHVGSQILEARYRDFRKEGYDADYFDYFPRKEIASNLKRLYLDLENAVE